MLLDVRLCIINMNLAGLHVCKSMLNSGTQAMETGLSMALANVMGTIMMKPLCLQESASFLPGCLKHGF